MDKGLLDILLFQGGYNTNLVLFSTLVLGVVSALVGAFIFLRGRTLISDAVSHATLPGIGLGFLVAFALGIEGGRHLPALLLGAAFTGALAALSVQWIYKNTRLNEDVAIGAVLGVFYGAGTVLLSFIQRLEGAAQAGLDSFLLGQVTGLSFPETMTITSLSLLILVICLVFLKELLLLCFDKTHAQTIGLSVQGLDFLLIGLMLAVVCTGLKTVGLILILALLIIPPVTARFWSDNIECMLGIAAFLGALSAYGGAAISAWYPDIPTGGAIVLCAGGLFLLSFVFAPKRGVIALHFTRKVDYGQ